MPSSQAARSGGLPPVPLIPYPTAVEPLPGEPFAIVEGTTIHVADDEGALRAGEALSALIGRAAGPRALAVERGAPPGDGINLHFGPVSVPGDEAYELTVTPGRVTIQAPRPAGLFYGVQTFRQLLPPFLEHEALRFEPDRPLRAPAVRVLDAPRFGWRGAMLDVARHFFGVPDVKRFIDLLALHKLNRLHLHLSDDQGWRIEIASWPNLARHGGSTKAGGGPGGYYSQDDYTEIVRYAEERFITIVPEIDVPGHTNAALSSYAELTRDGSAPPLYTDVQVGFSTLAVDKDITYAFIDDVVRELARLTPGPFIHIGGDEVQELPQEQYQDFIARVQAIVASHGKRTIGWDEIASAPLQPGTVVQHWRPKGAPEEAVRQGAQVIMSIANRAYLDMKYEPATPIGLRWAGCVDVREAYEWDPAAVPGGPGEAALLGVEAPLWTETVATMRDVEFLAFPRLAALAEVAWSPAARRTWEHFRERLGAQGPRWTALGINYYRSRQIPWAP